MTLFYTSVVKNNPLFVDVPTMPLFQISAYENLDGICYLSK